MKHFIRRHAWVTTAVLAAAVPLLAACGSPHVGVGIPVAPGVSVGVGTGGVSVGAGVGSGPVGAGVRVDHRGGVSVGAGAGTGPVGAGVSVAESGRVSAGAGAGTSVGVGGVSAAARIGRGTRVNEPPASPAGRSPERRPPSIWD